MWKRRLKDLVGLAAIAGITGVIVLISGIFPVRASDGHWAITKWFLDFASNRSIQTHATGIDVPNLDETGLIRLGAATFDTNCRWCHGIPDLPMPSPASQMTPRPPNLKPVVTGWDDDELFYIVKHGIKFAGMPAWASPQRDDEVWPVVAFLKQLPNMSLADYREHVHPTRFAMQDSADLSDKKGAIVNIVREHCAACHGIDGNGRAGDRVPKLSSQRKEYLAATLVAYRDGQRFSGVMHPITVNFTDEELRSFATHFSQQPRKPMITTAVEQDSDITDHGRRLATDGDREHKLASCNDCHAVNVDDDEGSGPDRSYPRLAGQPKEYLRRQLQLFREANRGGSSNASIMIKIAAKLNDDQIEAVSMFYANELIDPE
ncbi:c-type cytochrome [Roseiconus lacunae]|uniref:c-type cytochrome n=1 Tax=Roseiconus lacunae TaxID=2605694 RepID=UPI001E320B12|nr:c-type cytochrome [Roseiconus lacunae]MCD0460211.1 c-type cytochrome [Roseiconus lacunae]